ncbi:hypothetical protein QJS83_06595 [Bdellovibrio sp. 22V]|uniref:hypothetical protein n=1 Tax=Bdellovibrio TaxID=958 RepID=UPI002543CD27|nr:hypothetical protein [Bdellovibrio sp. 22V]WII73539.1 hypothetical protein QJS83_06595 [Bdellovibrio sp. 22V]
MNAKDLISRAGDLFNQATSLGNNKTLLGAGAILMALAIFQMKKDKEQKTPKESEPAVVFSVPGVGPNPFAREEPVVLTQDPQVQILADETNELKKENRILINSIKGPSFSECRKTTAGKEIAATPTESNNT